MTPSKAPAIGSIGVPLDDARIPPGLYELDTLYSDGECDIVSLDDGAVYETHIADFWILLDTMPH